MVEAHMEGGVNCFSLYIFLVPTHPLDILIDYATYLELLSSPWVWGRVSAPQAVSGGET